MHDREYCHCEGEYDKVGQDESSRKEDLLDQLPDPRVLEVKVRACGRRDIVHFHVIEGRIRGCPEREAEDRPQIRRGDNILHVCLSCNDSCVRWRMVVYLGKHIDVGFRRYR